MENVIQTRKFAAKILLDVILGKIKVLDALKIFPKNSEDISVKTCFHILVHFEADEELRKKDPLYKETQDDFIVEAAEILLKGEALPVNIIKDYTDYYENTDLFYNKPKKTTDILQRLKRFINL